ncbi:MAG: pyridoxamine 5'-phosphate oxidase family protein [Anaerolineaceae bacterium]|nr:pyridoxamine 5'-phosphate oxidase family protein [Anaerolineaceae bacterium]
MAAIPAEVSTAWENRKGPVVLTTVDADGNPNAIYATCVSKFSEEIILVADNYFSKTLENILAGSMGSILFITKDTDSYQIKGSIAYHKDGELFDNMKTWNPKKHPGRAAAALKVEEVYKGAERLL